MAVEIERKYDLSATASALPPLPDLPGVTALRRLPDEELDATYHDTEDYRLARSRATLRRRTGGRDAGWHLKLPASDGRGRLEITAPLRGAGVPRALSTLVRSRTRGARLQPVVHLRTTREVLQLLGDGDRVLAEVADDTVTAELPVEPPVTHSWREVEVELVEGDEALLDEVEARLLRWGAVPSASVSKLARALGDRLDRQEPPPLRRGSAAEAVHAHLSEQVAELVARDPMVRRDETDAVHRMRVATRRLRSALKTFRPLLDRERTDPVRAELRHLAGVLGAARDAEVLRDRLDEQVASLPVELVLGPVRQRIADTLDERYRQAYAAVVAELDGRRYLALLGALDQLLADPPWTDRAQRSARKELPSLVTRAWHPLRRAHRAAEDATGRRRAHLLHDVRKAAKQARYAGEAVAPVVGRDAVRFAARAEAVQEALGEHQDSVASRQALRELGVQAHLAGENGFTFGLLAGLEELRAARADAAYRAAWDELDRKRVVGWLR